MLAILFSWIIIFFVLFTMGNLFVYIYNTVCKRDEQYSLMDTFLLGLFFTAIPLSISSFWLASNHYVLFAYLLFCVGYWTLRREHFWQITTSIKNAVQTLSASQIFLIVLVFISIILISIWTPINFDPLAYHYAHIRWNEEYPIVPGIGNLEDRFGFNSNYFLLSAIFTFRTFLGHPLFTVQSLVAVLVFSWILIEVFKSKYELKRVILFIVSIVYFYYEYRSIGDTSTDIIPGLVSFFILSRIILYPDSFKRNYLIYIFVPLAVAAFKVSAAPLALISLFALIEAVRSKEYRVSVFICCALVTYFILWIIRTVIISGYLVYPIYEIDLFSFDWKVPQDIAVKQRYMIDYFANAYVAESVKVGLVMHKKYYYILVSIYFLAFTSIPLGIYYAVKNKNKIYIYVIVTLITCLFYWFFFAHDFRFGSGYVFTVIFLGVVSVLNNRNWIFPKLSMIVITLLILWMTVFSARSASYYWDYLDRYELNSMERFIGMIKTSYNVKDKMIEIKSSEVSTDNYSFTPYKLNDGVSIKISSYHCGWCFDSIPSITDVNVVPEFWTARKPESIDARGNSIKDGFKTK